jgi:hypothetical protein
LQAAVAQAKSFVEFQVAASVRLEVLPEASPKVPQVSTLSAVPYVVLQAQSEALQEAFPKVALEMPSATLLEIVLVLLVWSMFVSAVWRMKLLQDALPLQAPVCSEPVVVQKLEATLADEFQRA